MYNPNDLGRGIGHLKIIIQEFESAMLSVVVEPQLASQKIEKAGRKLAHWVDVYSPQIQELYGSEPVQPSPLDDTPPIWHKEYPEQHDESYGQE